VLYPNLSLSLASLATPCSSLRSSPLSFVKVIENATWFGIACLVLWEVYINSPFFERAAPMAPVVY